MNLQVDNRGRVKQPRRRQAGDTDQDLGDAERLQRNTRPASRLPMARPAMNAANTVLAA